MQSMQLPLFPHALLLVPSTQAFAEQQKPPVQVPSPGKPHSLVHAPMVQVGVPRLHGWQAVPVLPHSALVIPLTQVVPLQHPPLQVSPPVQLDVHLFVMGSHVRPKPQSCSVLQPQNEPLLPTMHACPTPIAVQSAQSPPLPHAVGLDPATQVPTEQQ